MPGPAPYLLPEFPGPGAGSTQRPPTPAQGLVGPRQGKELGMQATARARGGTDQLRGWGPGGGGRSPKSPKTRSTRSEAADYTGWRWRELRARGGRLGAAAGRNACTEPPGQARSPRRPGPWTGGGASGKSGRP